MGAEARRQTGQSFAVHGGVDGESAGGAGFGEPGGEGVRSGDAVVGAVAGWGCGLGGRGGLRGWAVEAEALGGAAEALGVQPGAEFGAVGVAEAELVERFGERGFVV